ncbi:NAD(P)H-dependent oxidoreductase [Winogradskyella maritima]|uniref:NAD(P)H-dependent oxidoreductase n=1 Tax=Winogradskyella maritima TaxID=1517766 RepID=A0ABV8AC22_9FLAO|nr:NAD(P)H-dependent oxidoreductase [Winogradskyella maritima]
MDIISSLKWRYATKKFDATKKLSDEKMGILKEAFNLTALSYGLQTLRLIVIESNEKRKALVAHAFGQRQVADASHLLVLCIDTKVDAEDVDHHFEAIKTIRKTPDDILDPFKVQMTATIENMSDADKEAWTKNQAYIALGNLMTVCAVEKIDSCPMEGFNPKAFDEALGLKEKHLSSVLLLPVGYRASDDMFSGFKKVRKSVTETVIEL